MITLPLRFRYIVRPLLCVREMPVTEDRPGYGFLPTLINWGQRPVEGFKRHRRVVFIERVQRVLRIILVEGIEWITWVVLVHRIRGIAGIVLIYRVQWIFRIVRVNRIQRIIGTVLVERVEDIVVTLVLLAEARFGKRRGEEEEQRQNEEGDNSHGDPPESGRASAVSLLSYCRTAQGDGDG